MPSFKSRLNFPIRDWVFLAVFAGLALGMPGKNAAGAPPRYGFSVQVDAEAHTLTGTVKITVEEGDSRPRAEWWLHLPPNRFKDTPTNEWRRRVAPLSIGFNFSDPDPADLIFPNGVSRGDIEILSVQDEAGRPLEFGMEPAPGLPQGYHKGGGLLRVRFPNGSSGRRLRISFRTSLPNRHWEGWDDLGIFAENWHPVLLGFKDDSWNRDPFDPIPALFSGRFTFGQPGWAILGPNPPQWLETGGAAEIPSSSDPARSFPLIVLWQPEPPRSLPSSPHVRAFFKNSGARVGALALRWSEKIMAHLQREYGLPAPKQGITLVHTNLPTGRIWAAGNTVFIPDVHFHNHSIMDRLFVARLAAGVAEIWFGETVFANRDSQAWLHLGLTAFLALDFFEYTFGWDANIHQVVDWLSPKYREHFLESVALNLARKNRDPPLGVSLYHHPRAAEVLTTFFHKAPLVFRSLRYGMGEAAFGLGLREFFQQNRYRETDGRGLRGTLEAACEKLRPSSPCSVSPTLFFQQWFYGHTRVDYELASWEATPIPGGYHAEILVRRLEPAIMPVTVRVTTQDGKIHEKIIQGRESEERVEFDVSTPIAAVSLDPQEFLLEVDRQNNHSLRSVRVRPIYDWAKQKETLVTVTSSMGGNAIDGNSLGLGTTFYLDERNTISFVPVYSERQPSLNFEGLYQRKRVFHPDLDFFSRIQKLGGTRKFNVGGTLTRRPLDTSDHVSSLSLQFEEVESISGAEGPTQGAGKTNNISLEHLTRLSLGSPFSTRIFGELENSQTAFGSTFSYTRAKTMLSHTFRPHANHAIRLDLVRGWAFGEAPRQKQHLLGDPSLLRGYPRILDLVYDHVLGVRSEYRYVLTRKIFGRFLQTRTTELIFSYDTGKGWNNTDTFSGAQLRKNAGIGFSIDLNSLEMLTFPIRIEIAAPINDATYKDQQLIFFQVLSFF